MVGQHRYILPCSHLFVLLQYYVRIKLLTPDPVHNWFQYELQGTDKRNCCHLGNIVLHSGMVGQHRHLFVLLQYYVRIKLLTPDKY